MFTPQSTVRLQPLLLVVSCAALLSGAASLAEKYNLVMILTDDLDWGLVQYMSNVKKLQADGVTFKNYFVTDSLCCPSRSSIFTGRFPHNTGVFTNTGNDGGYDAFNAHGNQPDSFSNVLGKQGYATALLGKYLNGYNATTDPPAPGWGTWAVSDQGYHEFGYNLNVNGKVVRHGREPQDYLTDVLNGLAVDYVGKHASEPFQIEIATFAPHSPYTPAPRDANLFPDLAVPRTPAYNATVRNAPAWLAAVPPLTASLAKQIDSAYRRRAQAVQAVDKLIGDVRAEIERLGLADKTYIFFTSDNGYHLGQWRLAWGKQTAFDTDIHVPLVVVGPDIPKGSTVSKIVQNTDLCPTFAELAGTSTPARDGVSLVPLLKGNTVDKWRKVALIEHHGPNLRKATASSDPDMTPAGSGNNFADPTTYEALRGSDFVYVEYDSGERQYHDLVSDPHELDNTYHLLQAKRKIALAAQLQALRSCIGSDCHGTD